MAELDRLKRIVNSWLGQVRKQKSRRVAVYEDDDALMIITDLGLKMTPGALTWMTDNTTRMTDFLIQVYAAEEELDVDLIIDNNMIDPRLNPNVYEEENMIIFTADLDGDEYVIAEFNREGAGETGLF